MDVLNTFPALGPYMGVTRDTTVSFKINRKASRNFRVIVYGAYNAMGLIGSERNGIAVLDDDQKAVLCDDIEREDSGYFGPSNRQLNAFESITSLPWADFREMINANARARYSI
jgi:hypothetical protein